jgi:hypothetical protein
LVSLLSQTIQAAGISQRTESGVQLLILGQSDTGSRQDKFIKEDEDGQPTLVLAAAASTSPAGDLSMQQISGAGFECGSILPPEAPNRQSLESTPTLEQSSMTADPGNLPAVKHVASPTSQV